MSDPNDFDAWFDDFWAPPKPCQTTQEEFEAQLEDIGIYVRGDGTYEAKCCCCGEYREIYCDISEIPLDGSYEHYCGGSPRCCP